MQSSNTIQISNPTPNQINRLYVFGDSLSDVGKVFQATKGAYPPSPPYFQGRYSNGLVWVEYLASNLALTPKQNNNFAYGGANTGGGSINGIPGLLAQVQSFTKVHQEVNPNALYVLWAGANDYLHGATTDSTVSSENLSRAIQSLLKIGAKKILVANLPDLGKLPATRNSLNSSTLSSLTIAHNLNLAKSVDALKQELGSDTQIIKLDVYSLYQEAITDRAKFGFTNVTSACLNNTATCKNPDKFLFWDGIHPTTEAHQILAKTALRALKTELELPRDKGI
ncbi:SGNH/GDSL hydrolase family protein [Iningainema tapete]|uniref:SGNH/GDSL hydrolase family protein n=1 Tax=Iningainema tapete BLCC-T55 TaxID=2748662 RepID=A0A8J6XK86_9CYAN|nr:SGNH/GDSL hydrolase family protein [Iningainema tapete]MBD2778445.1 SGNH/GDSL hydrolase family protein [Iningainema tapete BLCC-T55]